MSLTVSVLNGGSNSFETTSEMINFPVTDFVSEGIVGTTTNTSGVSPATGGFAVNAQGTPDMTIAVSSGAAYVTGTPTSGNSQTFRVKNSASTNVTISSNSTGGTRYDWVYIKLDPDKLKDPATDASDTATLVTSRSTSATSDDGTPPTYGYNIAVVTVSNGASSISNGNITDKRTRTGSSSTTDNTFNSYKFFAYHSSTQSVGTSATQVSFNTEVYDKSSNFASNTFTAPVAGDYVFTFQTVVSDWSTAGTAEALLYKNGSTYVGMGQEGAASNTKGFGGTSPLVPLAAGDTVKVYISTSSHSISLSSGVDKTFFSGYLHNAN